MRKRQKSHCSFDPDAFMTILHRKILHDLTASSSSSKSIGLRKGDQASQLLSPQIDEWFKRYQNPSQSTATLTQATLGEFMRVNRYVGRFTGKITTGSNIQSSTSFREKVLIRARVLVARVLGDLDLNEWFDLCQHSGGTTIGVPYVDTSIERKFTPPYSCTVDVIPLHVKYRERDELLARVLRLHEDESDIASERRYDIVRGARATTVDKTADKRRMIAVEPTLNMFFQQGLMELMYRRMEAHGMDVARLPEQHRQLAFEGSVGRHLATIDFSSASDTVSRELVRYLFPREWYKALDTVRSKYLRINGDYEELSAFSTMGNATTFPIETLVFWSLSNAVVFTLDEPGTNSIFTNYTHKVTREHVEDRYTKWAKYPCSVFGDDCILPTRAALAFMQVCEGFGFIPNLGKSHWEVKDPFRESCGEDFYHGKPTRPFKPKGPQDLRKSSLVPWLHYLFNSLKLRYIQYHGELNYVYAASALRYILRNLQKLNKLIFVVPLAMPDDSGIHDCGDLERLGIRNYRLSPVEVSPHGLVEFRIMRFSYRNQEGRKSSGIRYWDRLRHFQVSRYRNSSLKGPTELNLLDEALRDRKRTRHFLTDNYAHRRNGGYVVGKPATPCWGVPQWLVDH